MKSGTTVVIEGSEDEIQSLLSRIEKVGESNDRPKSIRASQEASQRSLPSATDAILELKRTGFFDTPKGLGAIREKLALLGMIYPVTTLSGVVLALIRRRALGRVREGAHWGYVAR
jgi:hypothetical protein